MYLEGSVGFVLCGRNGKLSVQGVVGVVFGCIAGALAHREDTEVAGFGRFAPANRPASEGSNRRTGECIAAGPSAAVSFRASKALKDAPT